MACGHGHSFNHYSVDGVAPGDLPWDAACFTAWAPLGLGGSESFGWQWVSLGEGSWEGCVPGSLGLARDEVGAAALLCHGGVSAAWPHLSAPWCQLLALSRVVTMWRPAV